MAEIMDAADYIFALQKAGISARLPVLEIDRQAAKLLGVSTRTARRYRCGKGAIPGHVWAVLRSARTATGPPAAPFDTAPRT